VDLREVYHYLRNSPIPIYNTVHLVDIYVNPTGYGFAIISATRKIPVQKTPSGNLS